MKVYRHVLVPDHEQVDTTDLFALRDLVIAGFAHYDTSPHELSVRYQAKRPLGKKNQARWIMPCSSVAVQARRPGEWSGVAGLAQPPTTEQVDLSGWRSGDNVKITGVFHPKPPGSTQAVFKHHLVTAWMREQCERRGIDFYEIGASHGELGRGISDTDRTAVSFRQMGASGIISDPEAFTELLADGIGPSAEFGAGLVTAKAKDPEDIRLPTMSTTAWRVLRELRDAPGPHTMEYLAAALPDKRLHHVAAAVEQLEHLALIAPVPIAEPRQWELTGQHALAAAVEQRYNQRMDKLSAREGSAESKEERS